MVVSGQACRPVQLQATVRVVHNEEKGAHIVSSYTKYTLQTLQQLWVLMCEVKTIRQLRAADCCSVVFLLRWF